MPKTDDPGGPALWPAKRDPSIDAAGTAVTIQGELTGSEPVLVEGRFQGKSSSAAT
jgi:hypothetical protein